MSPWKFVEGFAQNISCNPAQATVPGTVGRLDERGLLSSSAETIEISLGNSSSIFNERATRTEVQCDHIVLLKTLALTTDCLTDITSKHT